MPRISEQTRQERRDRIVDAATEVFTANGFHATSMDDILAAAGMSAGGAYRYFAGKDEIVAAVAERVVGGMTSGVDSLLADGSEEPFSDAVVRLLGMLDAVADGPGRLAMIVWGEAQRDPAIAALAQVEASKVRASIRAFVERAHRAGELPEGPSPDDVAAVLFAMFPGYVVQRRIIGDVDADAFAASVARVLGVAGS